MAKGRFMNKTIIYLLLIVATTAMPALLCAGDDFPQRSIEASLNYDYLTPDKDYADWKSAEFKYFHRYDPKSTIMAGIGESIRDESFAWVQTALYHDWKPWFSTYTSLTGATQTKWVGNFRFDNDFNIKFGSKYQYILTTGQTAIWYDTDKVDYLLSVGGILYYPHLIIDARHYFNRSDPGKVWSGSERLSVGFGTRGKCWTTIIASTGDQRYLGLAQQVNQDVKSISISEDIWLNSSGGIRIGAGYLTIENGYDKYNGNIGCFWQLP
jgi:YaiO family outer membrane protein